MSRKDQDVWEGEIRCEDINEEDEYERLRTHLKYGCFIASSAVIRISGSYVRNCDKRSTPAAVI